MNTRKSYRYGAGAAALVVAFALCWSSVAWSSDPPQTGFACPQLATLDAFAGPWHVTESHFNSRGEVVATVKGMEEVLWVLDARAISRKYNTKSDAAAYEALGMLTWSQSASAYQGTWFDNVTLDGPRSVTAQWDEGQRTMTYTISALQGGGVNYRVIDRFTDLEHRSATTFRVDGNTITKVMEVRYDRAKPCPDSQSIRILPG
jgi:hypothetical protein